MQQFTYIIAYQYVYCPAKHYLKRNVFRKNKFNVSKRVVKNTCINYISKYKNPVYHFCAIHRAFIIH